MCKLNLGMMKSDLELLAPCASKCTESILCRSQFLWKGIQLKKSCLMSEKHSFWYYPPNHMRFLRGPMSFNEKNHKKTHGNKKLECPNCLGKQLLKFVWSTYVESEWILLMGARFIWFFGRAQTILRLKRRNNEEKEKRLTTSYLRLLIILDFWLI